MLRFLGRYGVKAVAYYAVLLLFMASGALHRTPEGLVVPALALAGVNTLIRPLLVALALPFNALLFGVASIFANLLSLVIAGAIAGGALTIGFWAMLLIAFVIMLTDDAIRAARKAVRIKKAEA